MNSPVDWPPESFWLTCAVSSGTLPPLLGGPSKNTFGSLADSLFHTAFIHIHHPFRGASTAYSTRHFPGWIAVRNFGTQQE